MIIKSPNYLSDSEANRLAKSQGIKTVISISHLPDGSTSIQGF